MPPANPPARRTGIAGARPPSSAGEAPLLRLVPARVRLEEPGPERRGEFLAAVRRSRALHAAWVAPPDTRAAFATWLARIAEGSYRGHFVIDGEDRLAGVINIGEIVLGSFCSGHLGYYAFEPHAGRGLMRAGLEKVLGRAFRDYGLHRLEAGIQPGNEASRRLATQLGFCCEGFSPRYLKIRGRWRDHERWALSAETWRAQRAARRSGTAASGTGAASGRCGPRARTAAS